MLLAADNIHKRFRSGEGFLEVLRGASLALESRSLAVLSGPSGSGKSTLLYIIGGLEKPDTGEVTYKGDSIWDYGPDRLDRYRNRNVGFVFQMHYLMPDFTALENVMMPGLIAGLSFQEASQRGSELLTQLSVYDRKDHYPNQLSGGEQQRTAVARALINSPELILADEPTGNLDRENAESLLKLFDKLVETTGVSILIATHDTRVAESGRVAFTFSGGRIDVKTG
jgi:lipoprotein-releasing system ATP-binding protein